MSALRRCAPWLAGLAICGALCGPARAGIVAQWVQFGPAEGGAARILVRAVIDDAPAGCPVLRVDSTLALPMRARFDAARLGGFVTATAPGRLADSEGGARATIGWTECEAVVPAGHMSAMIDGAAAPLRLPVAQPRRILVIGDTGCRMARDDYQDCHDSAAFPLRALAGLEAGFAPDLIIHVGDYFYRDVDCLTAGGDAGTGCPSAASTSWGDRWDSWNLDFFYPAGRLLAAAPWVMVRGNHESCGRGARGWFALLDPRPFDPAMVACRPGEPAGYGGDFTPSYAVPAGALTLLVLDSSRANDRAVDPAMAAAYSADLSALIASLPAGAHAAIVTHKPAYGLLAGHVDPASGAIDGGTLTLQSVYAGRGGDGGVFRDGMPPAVSLLLSGHIHQFEYVDFADRTRFAPQLIVGVSGDRLDRTANPDRHDPVYASPADVSFDLHPAAGETARTVATHAYARAQFGFALLDRAPAGYVVSAYDVTGTIVGRCTLSLAPRDIACWR